MKIVTNDGVTLDVRYSAGNRLTLVTQLATRRDDMTIPTLSVSLTFPEAKVLMEAMKTTMQSAR